MLGFISRLYIFGITCLKVNCEFCHNLSEVAGLPIQDQAQQKCQ